MRQKIFLHIQFTGPYTEGMNYQENILPEYQQNQDTQVYFWAPCYAWVNGKIQKVPPESKVLSDGICLSRYSFVKVINEFVTRKLRYVKNVYAMLEELHPDYIMLHDFQSHSSLDIVKYVKRYPETILVVDSHTDKHNSGRNLLSKYILHRVYYRALAKRVAKYADRIFYLTEETKEYLLNQYGLHNELGKMDFLPLGGTVFEGDVYLEKRSKKRMELNLEEEDILVVHSGKMVPEKRTLSLVQALNGIHNKKIKLALIGEMSADVSRDVQEYIRKDARIIYLGWKTGEELLEYLCAADVYAQPGTQSATMQNAVCCNCAMILYPYSSHKALLGDSAFYVETVESIKDALQQLSDYSILKEYQNKAEQIGKFVLDYKVIAQKAALQEDCQSCTFKNNTD